MYIQANHGQAGQPRARGNAIQARKCVATTDNAFCFGVNATISSTASMVVTSVVVVSFLRFHLGHSDRLRIPDTRSSLNKLSPIGVPILTPLERNCIANDEKLPIF